MGPYFVSKYGWHARFWLAAQSAHVATWLVQVLLRVLAGVQGPYIRTRLSLSPRRWAGRLAGKAGRWSSTPCFEMESQPALALTLALV